MNKLHPEAALALANKLTETILDAHLNAADDFSALAVVVARITTATLHASPECTLEDTTNRFIEAYKDICSKLLKIYKTPNSL